MIELRSARPEQADQAAVVLADAFIDDPVIAWMFPDEAGRASLLPGFTRSFVDEALVTDQVTISTDGTGVAVWVRREAGPRALEIEAEPPPPYRPYAARMAIVGAALDAHHPDHEPHLYLPMLGVVSAARGRGLGGALLRHRLAEASLSAYLEATSTRSTTLYERHGFRPFGGLIQLPDGPSIRPMWRDKP